MQINFTTVLIVAVVGMVVGFLWYFPSVFGKEWARMSKMKLEDMAKNMIAYVLMFFGLLVMATVFSYLADGLNIKSAVDGAVMGILLWLGFVATTFLSTYSATMKPLKLYLIDSGFYLVILLLAGTLIGAMR